MNPAETSSYLRRFQNWRRGKDERTMDEAGLDPATIGIAIDDILTETKILREENTSLRSRLAKCQVQRERFHSQLRRNSQGPSA